MDLTYEAFIGDFTAGVSVSGRTMDVLMSSKKHGPDKVESIQHDQNAHFRRYGRRDYVYDRKFDGPYIGPCDKS